MMNSLITRVNDMDRVFNQIWNLSQTPTTESTCSTQRPRVDVEETGTEFLLRMDLPGVKREDLKVEIENNTLLIEAERKTESREDMQVLHRERPNHARFARSFSLGESIKTDAIIAQLADGVLELTIPKSEKALPRRINVE
jgi:HSP20 family protein